MLMRQQRTTRISVGLDIIANQVLTDQIRIMQMSAVVIVHPLEDTRVLFYVQTIFISLLCRNFFVCEYIL